MKGIVFDIQYNALYDGGGIRSLVFLKGCPLRCLWCHNPESQLMKPQLAYFAEKCTGCGECVKACPEKALVLKKKRPERDAAKCLICGACAGVCPNRATELIGREMSPAEIAEKVERAKVFYDNSGGGVTISGGEGTMQPEFLLETLRQIKSRGIHTALETCGFFKESLIPDLLAAVDLFLFDIKHINPEKHKELTGVSNELILSNFEKLLAGAGAERVVPRIPVIPGANADREEMTAIAAYLARAGHPGPVHLMPYNSMAKTKWEKVGRAAEYINYKKLTDGDIEEIRGWFRSAGLDTVCNQ